MLLNMLKMLKIKTALTVEGEKQLFFNQQCEEKVICAQYW